jgi:ethanolamine ammonia-lyase small subunit
MKVSSDPQASARDANAPATSPRSASPSQAGSSATDGDPTPGAISIAGGPSSVTPNPWESLRRFTPARIALGRSGVSVPTAAHLAFQFAHAKARDAVHRALDVDALARDVESLGLETLRVRSAAGDRTTYLQRPDLGRRLDDASRERLRAFRAPADAHGTPAPACDLAFVVADGLSSAAVQRHAAPLLGETLTLLRGRQGGPPWHIAPVVLAEQGRVALGDDIGEALGVRLVAVLIGERPGLSSPDSVGVYLTWSPRVGCTDAQRNCISNVRPEGLPYVDAAAKLCHLLEAAMQRQLTGVGLKDESGAGGAGGAAAIDVRANWLLGA